MESLPSDTQPRRRKPFDVPVVFAPIYLPLLFLAWAMSIPWNYIQKSEQRRKERRFMEQMKKAGRLMEWREFKQAGASGEGTAIGEYMSLKGPFRLWWTAEDIPKTSPHACEKGWREEWMELEPETQNFFRWCYSRFTNPDSGLARLVVVPENEREGLTKTLASVRYVATYSYRSLREERRQEN